MKKSRSSGRSRVRRKGISTQGRSAYGAKPAFSPSLGGQAFDPSPQVSPTDPTQTVGNPWDVTNG